MKIDGLFTYVEIKIKTCWREEYSMMLNGGCCWEMLADDDDDDDDDE